MLSGVRGEAAENFSDGKNKPPRAIESSKKLRDHEQTMTWEVVWDSEEVHRLRNDHKMFAICLASADASCDVRLRCLGLLWVCCYTSLGESGLDAPRCFGRK